MKILHVAHKCLPNSVGGVEVYCHSLCQRLSQSNEIHLLTTSKSNTDSMHNGFEANYSIHLIDSSILQTVNPRQLDASIVEDKVREIIRNVLPDLVHVHHLAGLSAKNPRDNSIRIPDTCHYDNT